MRMRDGKVTEEDWRLLLQHSPNLFPLIHFAPKPRLLIDFKNSK